MGKLEPFNGQQTNWEGLWYNHSYNGFSSAVFSLADLRKFKGNVRLFVRKNKFYNNGENGRPNYVFCIKDADSNTFREIEVIDDEDSEGEETSCKDCARKYTYDEVMRVIDGVIDDVKRGYTDLLPEDYV